MIFFQLVNNFLGAILSSYKYFTLTILTSLITSLFSIVATIFFYQYLGITGTLAAVAGSYAINFLFLIAVMKLRLKWQFNKFTLVKSKQLWRDIGLMQLNILPVWLRNYVVLFLLSGLGAGIISSVNLAQQTAGIFDMLVIAQVLSVAGIKFNELYAKADIAVLNELFIRVANFLLLLLMPVVAILFFYAPDIAVLIFKRGNITSGSLDTVALCLQYLILLSPLMLLNSLCTRIFSATRIMRQGLLYSITAHIIFLILTVILINWLQLKGYLYAMLAGYSIIIFFFYRLIKIKLNQIDFAAVLKFGFKQLVINLIIALPVFWILKKLNDINYIAAVFIAALIQVVVVSIINKKQLHFSGLTIFGYGSRHKEDME